MKRITFLGTGTSTGVPQLLCDCEVCRSTDKHDKRLRSSLLVSTEGSNILIDCGPDFRMQMIEANQPHIDALLITHSHYDHVGGIDDLRPYSYTTDFFPVYCSEDVARHLKAQYPYCFPDHFSPRVPNLSLHPISTNTFKVGDVDVTPIPVMHGEMPILGFRIGTLAYITDCKTISEDSLSLLEGVETLVINALRQKPHPTHMNLDDTLGVISKVKPHMAYLTHMSHEIGLHREVQSKLPNGVILAYDGLTVDV